jgi:redox-sensitive bicupin YhaK (pirin superfamily)
MLRLRKSVDRGHADHGWLNTYHTFSFADYYDPDQMGFRSLRVMNEDRVQPGRGFGTHAHKDMEIITYVLEGALEHRDSLGNGSLLRAGELQRMTAGTGVLHSEFNPSSDELVHFYQIWLLPERLRLSPGYEQCGFGDAGKRGKFLPVATRDGRNGSLTIHQDAEILLSLLGADEPLDYSLQPDRYAWLQVLRGEVDLNGHLLEQGDGAAISGEPALALRATSAAEVMLFDLK